MSSQGSRVRAGSAPFREVDCFVRGLWTGIGVVAAIGGTAWFVIRRVLSDRAERTLPRRLDRLGGNDTYTLGDYSSLDSADFRAQALSREESYAARERNQRTIQSSLVESDFHGRTEVQPWLEIE